MRHYYYKWWHYKYYWWKYRWWTNTWQKYNACYFYFWRYNNSYWWRKSSTTDLSNGARISSGGILVPFSSVSDPNVKMGMLDISGGTVFAYSGDGALSIGISDKSDNLTRSYDKEIISSGCIFCGKRS